MRTKMDPPDIKKYPDHKPLPMKGEVVHLHWSWNQNPHLIHGISQGISVCKDRGVPIRALSVKKREVTCKKCLHIANFKDDGLGRA